MTQYLFSRSSRAVGLAGLLAALLAGVAARPAVAADSPPPIPAKSAGVTSVDTSACTDPTLRQAFLSAKDNNWYTLVPGQAADGFNGDGWSLRGGARVAATQLQDGRPGTVLDLPSGARAVSPAICVTADYPMARTIVRNVAGAEGVQFYVAYAGTKTWLNPQNTGQFHGHQDNWTLSSRINLVPGHQSGWQIVRFELVGGGKSSDFQVYDFNVDPRMKA
jgi:hypothetical protein